MNGCRTRRAASVRRTDGEVVGVADHYAAFLRLVQSRICELGITCDTVDALCGFPLRYTSTLLSGGKTASGYSLFTLAGALALRPVFQHDSLH